MPAKRMSQRFAPTALTWSGYLKTSVALHVYAM